MKRPIFIATIAYINGIIIGIYLQKCIFLLLCLLLIFAIITLIYLIKNKQNKYMIAIIYMIIALSVSLYTSWLNKNFDNKYRQYNDKDVKIIGTIISTIENEEYKTVFTVKVEKINDIKCNGDNFLINLKKSKEELNIKYGDKVIFEGTYTEPDKARNYKGFNYKNYLKTKKIYGKITTKNIKIIEEKNLDIFSISINSLLGKIKDNIRELLPQNIADLAIGILTGYDNEIDENIINNFKDSSLSHMLAVSGTHVTYVMLTIFLILRKNWVGIRKQKILTIIILIFFMILTGKTPSVSRAVITTVVYVIASLLYRKADIINIISISVLITLLQNPFNIFNIGMQLSYAGTIGIILFYNILNNKITIKNKFIRYIIDSILISISANIFIIPIMMYKFNTISLTFMFSNLLASPILGLIMILEIITVLISFVSLKLAIIPSLFLDFLLRLLIKIADIFSKIQISKIIIATPSLITIILIYVEIMLVYYFIKNYKNKTVRNILKVNIILALVIIIVMENMLSINIDRKLFIYFIDVGQGDSTLIITPTNKKILIDGGGNEFSNDFDIGEKVLLPYILNRKIKKIDYVLISHCDSDHVQGLFKILEELEVEQIIISKQIEYSENYEKLLKILKKRKIIVTQVKTGDRILVEKDLYIDIIWPTQNQILENPLNNNSIVCKLNYCSFSMLFTGDIEKIAEEEILKTAKKDLLKADVLKVAHHGSKTSSTQELLEVVKPKMAIIGVGKDNKFGHPNDEVIGRFTSLRNENL